MLLLNNKYCYRLLVCVEYNGTLYHGWQKQNHYTKLNSIQYVIENTLSKICKHNIKIYCSSRTDLGVHSMGQTFHFDTFKYKKEIEWLKISNYNLPEDIAFKWVKFVSLNFHARYNVLFRRYRYILLNTNQKYALLNNLVYIYPNILNLKLMRQASKFLLGKHDFTIFRSSGCQSLNTIKNIIYINIFKVGLLYFFDIKANSFLYRMVRNIISCLLFVGTKKYSLNMFKEFWFFKNKNIFKFNLVKPGGLYLYKVYY